MELDPAEGHDEISLERALVPFSPMAGQNGEIQGERPGERALQGPW